MATSPYPGLSDEDWGRLLAIGAIHRHCGPVLRRFATGRAAGSRLLEKLHADMALHAAVAAQRETASQVVTFMRNELVAVASALRTHPDGRPADHEVFEQMCQLLGDTIDEDDPFEALYRRCEEACARLYGRAWVPPAPFALLAVSAHPRNLSDRYAIGGSTAPPDEGRSVRLRICPSEFGPEAFAVMVRVLLHELICHVGAADGDAPDALSPFSEGLMDWTSLHYLRAWSPIICGGYARAAIIHAQQSAGSFKPDAGTVAARDAGEEAALILCDQGCSDTDVARLAIEINAARRPRAPKNEFVLRVLAGALQARQPPLRDVLVSRMSVEALLDAL